MSLFVDTSVWSLAFRRDRQAVSAEREALVHALQSGAEVWTTGLVLQELLQGVQGAKGSQALLDGFAALPFIVPDRQDHVEAAELRNACRRAGVQLGTIDALIASVCIRHDHELLTTDLDFQHASRHCNLKLWQPA